jgi:hypothetical protein
VSVAPVQHDSVHVLMGQVLAKLPAIGKDDQAPANMGGYNFRGIEAITAALKPLLGRVGVFVVPETIDRVESTRMVGKDLDRTMYVVDVHVRFTFYGPGGDNLIASAWGQGTDMGDKATQKAYTSAFKSMLAVAFCIADSATDSERHDVPETQTEPLGVENETVASEEDREAIKARIAALPDEQKANLRQQWWLNHSLRPYKPDELPAVLVADVELLLKDAEQKGDDRGAEDDGDQSGTTDRAVEKSPPGSSAAAFTPGFSGESF